MLRLAAWLLCGASAIGVSTWTAAAPQGPEAKPFTHRDHVDGIWFNPEVAETWRDCRGCHVFSPQQAVSAPQQFCDDCHGKGNLGKQFDPAWKDDLAGYRTRTRDAFRHHTHGMLECRECHLPASTRRLRDFDIVTGPGQCQRCHEAGAAAAGGYALFTKWRVFTGASDPAVAGKLGIAPWTPPAPAQYEAYAAKLAAVFAGPTGGINTVPLPPGGAFDHYDHGDLDCAQCHVGIQQAGVTQVGTGSIPSEGCAKCHRSASGPARIGPAARASAQPLWSLGTFSHADHYRFLGAAPRDPAVAGSAALAQLRDAKDGGCSVCHTFDPAARGLPADDFPFAPGKSKHRYLDCIGCHDVAGWQTGEQERGTGRTAPLHDSVAGTTGDGQNGWNECGRCHDFAARDFAMSRPQREVRRFTAATFEFGVHTHPDITQGMPKSGRGPLGDCARCHRARVPELPSRLEQKAFRHATHLAAGADAAACRECHPRAGDAKDATALAAAGRTYTLDACANCHLGSMVKEVARTEPAVRTVVEFPHGPHAAKAQCADCHEVAADGADVTTKAAATNCSQCHDHEAATAGPSTERLFDAEVQSCVRCHHDDAAGGATALSVPPIRGSGPDASDRRYNAQQSAFAGFVDNQFHPLGGQCADCHKAVEVAPGTEGNMLGLKLKTGNHLPATWVSPHAGQVGKDPAECLRCHWKTHSSGSFGDGVRGTQDEIRWRSNPSSAETRQKFGNLFEGYPGTDKAKG